MLFFISNVVGRIFRKTTKSVASAAEAKAKRETVGKAEAKIQGAQQKVQQKALRSMDKLGPEAVASKVASGNTLEKGNGSCFRFGYPPRIPVETPPGGAAVTIAIDAKDLIHNQHATKPIAGWIVVLKGDQKGQDFRLFDGENTIGTAAHCDIVIYDPFLSAQHCSILIDSKEAVYVLRDLDSRNGVCVNQRRVTKTRLIDNDIIRLGGTEVRFKSLY